MKKAYDTTVLPGGIKSWIDTQPDDVKLKVLQEYQKGSFETLPDRLKQFGYKPYLLS